MANQYDTNLKLQAIADAIGDSGSSGLISALEDIADAVAGGGGGGSSIAGLVSDNFSETDTYDLGDYCIHNNTLYVCINAITTPGTWDLSDWQATNAGLELSSLNSALTGLSGKFAYVSGTMASAINTEVNIPYPQGFSDSSGFIIAGITSRNLNSHWYLNHPDVSCFGDDVNVRVKTSSNGFLNQPFKVLLIKL